MAVAAGPGDLWQQVPLPEPALLGPLLEAELLQPWARRQLQNALIRHTGVARSLAAAQEPEQLATRLRAWGLRYGLRDLEAIERASAGLGLPPTSLDQLACFPDQLAAAVRQVWEPEVAGHYIERRNDLESVSFSLLRLRDADLATEFYFQLQEGSVTLQELALRHGEPADRARRGFVGPLPISQLHPLIARILRRHEPGTLVPPVDIDGTVHLIRVEERSPARLDAALRQRLLNELRDRWLNDQWRAWCEAHLQVPAP
ncbi:peptidylprolyl isomerase [Synechococcus sp. RSCCF101]|uniref:peptidylprolyl isomerase n=1 Tax=Synechococcus sp. RSCCF101 TaxID=2511069 RepID=UPI001248015C|nr:peptidylprolyl isomerase [Synechococcus sp. RSCCF101]QEY31785.1 peptidylprolyl isomerase [Synechococcus sp. RSCCF101]